MVCSRGESLTHCITQMKLLNAIAAAAVIGVSVIAVNPAQASTKVITKNDYEECNKNWKSGQRACSLPGKKDIAKTGDGSQPDIPWTTGNGCPPGTRHYRTNGLFGLGARDIGCMSAYEAESLRRQNAQNFQNNLNRNRTRNCTTNLIGSTAYTNCY